jgi:hypothetical protein
LSEDQIEAICGLAWDAVNAARDLDLVEAERLLDAMEKQLREVVTQRPECPEDIS